jgi:hypothetical protein
VNEAEYPIQPRGRRETLEARTAHQSTDAFPLASGKKSFRAKCEEKRRVKGHKQHHTWNLLYGTTVDLSNSLAGSNAVTGHGSRVVTRGRHLVMRKPGHPERDRPYGRRKVHAPLEKPKMKIETERYSCLQPMIMEKSRQTQG